MEGPKTKPNCKNLAAEGKCRNCNFYIADDGHPYCLMKDLYTNVEPDSDCDEKNILGEYYFSERKEPDFDGEGDNDCPEEDYE